MSRLGTPPALLLLAGVMLSACYDTRSTRVQLRTSGSNLDCFATADRVFSSEGFVADMTQKMARLLDQAFGQRAPQATAQ